MRISVQIWIVSFSIWRKQEFRSGLEWSPVAPPRLLIHHLWIRREGETFFKRLVPFSARIILLVKCHNSNSLLLLQKGTLPFLLKIKYTKRFKKTESSYEIQKKVDIHLSRISSLYPEIHSVITRCWFQPIWKILYSQIGSFPQVRVKIKK